MDDIGVNEDVVIRRRRKCMATETIEMLAHTLRNKKIRSTFSAA
jgi:ribosome-associated protein YbcJ (S4-like RNA binding protein)